MFINYLMRTWKIYSPKIKLIKEFLMVSLWRFWANSVQEFLIY